MTRQCACGAHVPEDFLLHCEECWKECEAEQGKQKNLAAAAPDLLRELKHLVAIAEELSQGVFLTEAIASARAAIAKAEGKQ